MTLRWASMVFRDHDGVVHYCQTDQPKTVCGQSRLTNYTCISKTIRLGDGLPLSPISVLPLVTCMMCIVLETPPAWA